jgi:hypothetical protein
MNNDWQTYAATAVVFITSAWFCFRAMKKKKTGGCASCGSSTARKTNIR